MTDEATAERMIHYATERGYRETERRTYQAMEAFIHNLNTMHSRAARRRRSLPSTTAWIPRRKRAW